MLTLQGSILIGLGVVVASVGMVTQEPIPAATGMGVILWIWLEWIWFEMARRQMKKFIDGIKRQINQEDAESLTLVADRWYSAQFLGDSRLLPRGYRVLIRDTIPDTFAVRGESSMLIETDVLVWFSERIPEVFGRNYKIQTPICGSYQFPGLQIELTDQRGLFSAEFFATRFQRVNVLPFLIRPQTTVSVLKRNNLQRHLGHHRNASAGISSELHGIRDYRVGDPPRSIAWKATARLGKVMTCEFESEVPIRATVLVDLAMYQFDGRPGATAGDRAISTAASLAKLLLADRDPVAAELIHDDRFVRLNHGSGERQLAKIVQHLLEYSNPHPPMQHFFLDDLIQIVFENASRRFPELFDERINQGPIYYPLFETFVRWFRRRGKRKETTFYDRRKRRLLAVAFEYLFQLEPGYANRIQIDNFIFKQYCLAYAEQYNLNSTSTTVAIDPPYRDISDWMRARNNLTLSLCDRITNVRARAKDNELFVVVAPEPHDILGCEMLETAVKKVIASGHRLMFVAPERPLIQGLLEDETAAAIVNRYSTGSYRNAHSELGERLGRVGATFARIDHPQLMQLVANEIGILQSSASRSRSSTRAMSAQPFGR